MKILIDNYADSNQTEPFYFDSIFNQIEGCKSTIWHNPHISAYDMFDSVTPDIYITKPHMLTRDKLAYLVENKNIQLVLNITGVNEHNLKFLENTIEDEKISCPLVFTNSVISPTCKYLNVSTILCGADLFLPNTGIPKYKLQRGIFVQNKTQIYNGNDETYHYISTNNNLINDVDIVMPAVYLQSIYHSYEKLSIRLSGDIVPQYLFDAIAYGNNVSCELPESNPMYDKVTTIMGISELKRYILSKHTCYNRFKSLVSQLSCGDVLTKLEKIMGAK
jgi:hypothetical protein